MSSAYKTEIEHKFALGDFIRAPYIGGMEGTIIGVSKDINGSVAYTVSAWSIRGDLFQRHQVLQSEIEDFTVIPKTEA